MPSGIWREKKNENFCFGSESNNQENNQNNCSLLQQLILTSRSGMTEGYKALVLMGFVQELALLSKENLKVVTTI